MWPMAQPSSTQPPATIPDQPPAAAEVPAQRATEPAAGPAAPPAATTAPAKRRLAGRRIALIAGIAAALVLISAGWLALNVYDEKTKIDRSTPTVAVTQLVDALFTQRDESAVARFSCRKPQLAPLRDLAADLAQREKRFNTRFAVTVRNLQLKGSSTVEVELGLAASGTEDVQPWIFETVDEDGWRVCSARKAA